MMAAPMDIANPTISIIVPVYNAAPYLERSLGSVLAQQLTDFELILINDGSTDASGSICDSFAAKDCRIRVFHQENAGPSVARNRGIELALGQYIGFVDADDSILPSMYLQLHALAVQTGAEICFCNYASQVGAGQRLMDHGFQDGETLRPPEIREKLIRELYRDSCRAGLLSMCNKLFSRDFIMTHNMRCDALRVRAEDAFFCLEAYRKATCIAFSSDVLYVYHCNSGSIMQSVRPSQFADWKRNIQELYDWNDRFFHFDIEKAEFLRGYLINMANHLMDLRESTMEDRQTLCDDMLTDPFFMEMLKHDHACPLHYRLLNCQLRSGRRWRQHAGIALFAGARRIAKQRHPMRLHTKLKTMIAGQQREG